MRNRRHGNRTGATDRLTVRNAAVLAVAAAALLSCVLTALFYDPPEYKPDPETEKAAAEAKEAQDLRRLAIKLQVAVEFWFKDHLKDPDSLEVIQWSTPTKTASGQWLLAVKYRAKNSFGGHAVESRLFTLDSDASVIDSRDISRIAK